MIAAKGMDGIPNYLSFDKVILGLDLQNESCISKLLLI